MVKNDFSKEITSKRRQKSNSGSPGTRERVLHADKARMLKGLEASKSRGRKFKIFK